MESFEFGSGLTCSPAEYFNDKHLTATGVLRLVYDKIEDKDIPSAISYMKNRDREVEEAIREYNPEMHNVMFRRNKRRKNNPDYIVEKLPRTRQQYINNVELFFLLGRPVEWTLNSGSEKAFALFKKFLADTEFNENMREAKRLAGAETESAKVYRLYSSEERNIEARCFVASKSKGYKLRPLIDQYGKMIAFALGYTLDEGRKNIPHWDIETADFIFYCRFEQGEWKVNTQRNPTGKINSIYYLQPKAWSGAERRIDREEHLDSKVGDTNNYFADPIAAATADVIELLKEDTVGKMIALTGPESKFSYIDPPQSSESRSAEKSDLNTSILFDTFTPDLSFESLKGMGTLSGSAMRRALVLGYIKRDNNQEIYGRMLKKELSVIVGILKTQHPDMAKSLDDMDVSFTFSEPFTEDKQEQWASIVNLYNAHLISRYTAISMLGITRTPQNEIDRILSEEKAELANVDITNTQHLMKSHNNEIKNEEKQ